MYIKLSYAEEHRAYPKIMMTKANEAHYQGDTILVAVHHCDISQPPWGLNEPYRVKRCFLSGNPEF